MPKDSCYHSVKARYDVFPSARASQAIAKCRKSKGAVRKTSKGTSLKRWQKEKWTDTKTGKACGAGGSNEYCRPKKRVSQKTPKTIGEISKSKLAAKKAEKSRVGMGNRVTSLSALDVLLEFSRDEEWHQSFSKLIKGRQSKEAKEKLRAIMRQNRPNWAIHKSGGSLSVVRDGNRYFFPVNKPLLPFGEKARLYNSRKKAYNEAYRANKRDSHSLATKRGIARSRAKAHNKSRQGIY